MSRQSFSLLRFPGRNSRASADPNEARYALSEVQRNDTFRKSLYDFQQQFVDEEKNQSVGEQERGKAFDDMMAGHNHVFETSQRRREQSFSEEDLRQEETYQKNEAGREVVFLEGQNGRSAVFESCQASRVEHSGWHNAARETLLLQGRQGRKEACAAIDAALVNQFNKLLKIQEDFFVSAESRRDSTVKQLVDNEVRMQPNSLIVNGTSDTSPSIQPIVMPPIPSFPHATYGGSHVYKTPEIVGFPSMRRSRSPSRTPPIIVRANRDRSPTYVHTVRPHSRSPSREERTPPPPDFSSASHNSQTKEGGSIDHPPSTQDPFEKRFTTAQQERLQTFLQEERQRESRFQAAESAREDTEAERTRVVDRKEEGRLAKFRTMLNLHEEQFRERETMRTEGDSRRGEAFNAALERQSHVFDTSLSEIKKQAEAGDKLEDGLLKHMKSMTEALSRRQVAQLEAAREDQWTRFQDAQRRRDAELGLPTSAVPHPKVTFPHPQPPPSMVVYPEYPAQAPIIVQAPSRSSSRSHRRSRPSSAYTQHRRRRYSPRIRPFSPAVGFAAGALFRGAGVQDPLPVVGSDGTLNEELRQEMSFQNLQRRRQHMFERSQARREDAFEKNTLRRRHIFNVNEARRQTEFEKKQRTRKAIFEEKEDGREDDFKEAQRRRETSFRRAERGRETDFQRNERDRDRAFKYAQEKRADRFHKLQEELQKKCFEAEQRRFLELETWGARLLQGREREQMETCKADEETREDVFRRSLGAYVLKR